MKQDTSNRDPRHELVEVEGARLRVAVERGRGDQPPLLLLNGLGANLELLDPFVNALREVSRGRIGTIRFDFPGIGGSPAQARLRRAPGLARLAAGLLTTLGFTRADVLGISWGGGVAQQLAYQYPHRCRRLVLASTSTGWLSIPGRFSVIRKLASPWRYARAHRLNELDPQLYGEEVRRDPQTARRVAALMRPPTLLGYYLQLFALAGWSSLFWLRRLHQPALVLAGNDDPIVPLGNAQLLVRHLRRAQLHVVDGGHLCLITQATTVAPVVAGFLTAGLDQISSASALARSRSSCF
jgi:poly(3-hydroxyalkanoate) depolymerase